MHDTARQQLIERYIAAYNSFDIEGMAAVLSPDIRFDNVSQGVKTHETVGIDAFRTLALASKAMFSKRQQTVLALEFDPGQVIATVAFRGTLAVDLPGDKDGRQGKEAGRAGDEVAMEGRSIFTFDDHLIAGIVDQS